MAKSSTMEKVKQLPSPTTMSVDCIIGELHFGNPDSYRKKQLLNAAYDCAVNPNTIEDWLIGIKICNRKKFFPEPIMAKLQEVVRFIESFKDLNKGFLEKICQSKELPYQVVAAARIRSKVKQK